MNFDFIIRIIVCFALSFAVGLERHLRGRAIGLRTNVLVALGSFLFVTMAANIPTNDEVRMAAQVVSGIGFLGAGVIIKDGFKVSGLTTAATLWISAAIGMACGCGKIDIAVDDLKDLFMSVLYFYIIIYFFIKIISCFSQTIF